MIYWLWSPPTNVLLLFAKCLILKPDLQLSQSNLILILLTHALYTLTPKEDWIENGQHCNWRPKIFTINFYLLCVFVCFILLFVVHRFNNDVSTVYGILLCCLVLFHFNFLFVQKQSTVPSKNKSYRRYCKIKLNFQLILYRFRFVFFNDDKGINHVENRQNIFMKMNIITRRWELGICFQVVLSMLAIKSWLKLH